MSANYDMGDLLELLVSDDAEALSLHVGKPRVIHWRGEPHPVLGRPDITADDGERLLEIVAAPAQTQELRERGSTDFSYDFRGTARFRVTAAMHAEGLRLELERVDLPSR
jgi:Tfp pilus assembly pilus retraction ATPase PilT